MLSPSRLAMMAAGIVALGWLAPSLALRATQPERIRTTAYYSAVTGQFHMRTDAFDRTEYRDEAGIPQTAAEHRRVLPFVHYADLAKHGQFPTEVAGKVVTPEVARREMQVQQYKPQSWNAHTINLNTLLESAPWGTRLSLPDDMFRVEPAGLVFLRTADGSIDRAKSTQFTEALNAAGITWPLRALGGNPSPLKDFDEGYLLVDGAARLFQMKMVQGKPEVRDLHLSIPGTVRAIVVTEHLRREFIGAVVTDTNIFLAAYDGRLLELPADGFNADSHSVLLRTDPLNRTVATTDLRDTLARPARMVATDRDYRPMRSLELPLPEEYRSVVQNQRRLLSLLFPFSIIQFTPTEGRVVLQLRPAASPWLAVAGCAASALLLAAIRRRRRRIERAELLVPLLAGPPGLVCVLLFGPLTAPISAKR